MVFGIIMEETLVCIGGAVRIILMIIPLHTVMVGLVGR